MELTILVTGGAGFVGSNLCIQLKELNPEWNIMAFDNLRRRGSELNLVRLKNKGIKFFHGDVRSLDDLNEVSPFSVIIEASAEPSVAAGINGKPSYLIDTNLTGAINCLEIARKYNALYIFLSTSRIYPVEAIENLPFIESETRYEWNIEGCANGISNKGIQETFTLEGARTLYGSTKLSAEHFIQEYHTYFGLKTIVNRCGVIAGPWQMGKVDQGFFMHWIASHLWKKPLGYFGYGGTGKQVRDVIHIYDIVNLINEQIRNSDRYNGNVYNIGGGQESCISLVELTKKCENLTGNKLDIKLIPETKMTDIRIYITDNSKIESESNWRKQYSIDDILTDVSRWLIANTAELKKTLGY